MKMSFVRSVLVLFLCVPVVVGAEKAKTPAKSRMKEVAAEKPLMNELIGINGHFGFKPELYKQVCRVVRNYHNLEWDVKQPGDKPTFPVCVNRVDWKANVYGKWAKEGFETDICAQFGSFGPQNRQYRDLWKGKEQWAYTYGFEMAKYFGPSGKEKLCTSIEIGNEPGNGFDDALYKTIFTNMARGIRAADPKVKIVTCNAQSGSADKYTKSLQETFSTPEIKKLFDAINVHAYAFKPRGTGRHPWDRSYPEDPRVEYLKVVDAVIAWRDKEAAGKEIWITEFGWDACTDEAMKQRKGEALSLNWSGVTDLQQAQYLVRSLFCFSERDVRRAYIYNFDDNDVAGVHSVSGLTRKFQPKQSFWAVKHLYETLGEYRFSRVVKKTTDDVYIYEFIHGSNPKLLAWAVWSPTGNGREQQMTIGGLPSKPSKVERMAVQQAPGKEVEWKSSGAKGITLKVGESPVYVMMKK